MTDAGSALYWDASAVVSALIDDEHSADAQRHLNAAAHILSTLSYAETLAVLTRMHRSGHLSARRFTAVRASLDGGPWHRLTIGPAWTMVERLARRWPLRGADLWHLATACTLREAIPELRLLTFDQRLGDSAAGEGFA